MRRIIVLIWVLSAINLSYSQILWDTTTTTFNYVWTFEPTFDHPVQKQSYLDNQKKTDYRNQNGEAVKRIFLEHIGSFNKTYSREMLASLLAGILQSDVVLLDRPSEYVYEIYYGNYNNAGLGLQAVGVYTHCTIDISQPVIVPEFQLSFTY